MNEIYGIVERALVWLELHPSVVAWLVGWIAALTTAQWVKSVVLPTCLSVTTVKRLTQTVAILVGAAVAFLIWPVDSAHGHVYALVVGMSAPSAYTGIKLVLCWFAPAAARRLGWDQIVERSAAEPKP